MKGHLDVFEEIRPILQGLARRILGNENEVSDMVQETYLRWEKTDLSQIKSAKAFLTTTITRLCLNHLKLARVRLNQDEGVVVIDRLQASIPSPDQFAELADALTEAFTRMLANLSASERIVFLLREAFDFEYAEIAPIVERNEENCRQILKRARDRIASNAPCHTLSDHDSKVVQLFREATATGDLECLLNALSADAVLVRDGGDLSQPTPAPISGTMLRDEIVRQGQKLLAENTHLVFGHLFDEHVLLAKRNRQTAGAILFQVRQGQIKRIRMVTCPAMLRYLGMLSTCHFLAEPNDPIKPNFN